LILVGLALETEADRDWYTVATVNGVNIDRGTLRRQVAFEAFLYQEQVLEIGRASTAGHVTAFNASTDEAVLAQSLGDPVETARGDLVDQALIGQLARTAGVASSPSDPWAVVASFVGDGFKREVRWVDFAPSNLPSVGPPADAIARAQKELGTGTAVAAVAKDVAASGWNVSGDDRWIGMIGPIDGVDDGLIGPARSAKAGQLLGPFTTRTGDTIVGYLASVATDDPNLPASLAVDAQTAKVDSGTVAAWASAETLEVALRSTLLSGWLTTPAQQVRGQEFVVGPSAVSGTTGPWVDLVALDPASLPAADLPASLPPPAATPALPSSTAQASSAGTSPGAAPSLRASPSSAPPARGAATADALATWLRGQPAAARLRDILELTVEANAAGATGAARSGELGYLTASQVVADVGTAAFAPGRVTGDVLGPIDVAGRPLLFYVEGRYAGELDDRSAGALTELMAPGADLAKLVGTFAPDRASLATDSGWWSIREFASGDPTGVGLFDTPEGELSDPVSLAGDLAIFRPEATRTALPDAAIAARLTVEGYASWFAAARAAAKIVLAANPLPEAYPSATPATSSPPTIAPLPTPVIPGLPGASGPPATQNPFAPPTLPGGLPGLPSLGP
jgi:hypothetical protein